MERKFDLTGKLTGKEGGRCFKCQKHKPLAEVKEIETGKIEWRCRGCVYGLKGGRDIGHKLAKLNLEKMCSEIEKSK